VSPSDKRVLVTGARGFIGSHCLEPLVRRGYEVHAVSRSDGLPTDGVTWHSADLLHAETANRLVETVRPSHLLHLAWYVVPGELISAPENFRWVQASFELVRSFADVGGRRVAVCGTCYEYDWAYGYCTEELTPTVPDTVYGSCKHALHELLRAFASTRELTAAWPRVFFLYGPNEHPQRLVSSVILSLLRGEPAKTSHGRQVRDYMHVQDVADGLVAVLDSDVTGAINVSSAQASTLRDIVLTTGRLLERPDLIELGALPARANDVPLVVGANTRARALGWEPQYDLEAGLEQTIGWWKAHDTRGNGQA
jgi:nucleoside-diphosphate-sugar epimerase